MTAEQFKEIRELVVAATKVEEPLMDQLLEVILQSGLPDKVFNKLQEQDDEEDYIEGIAKTLVIAMFAGREMHKKGLI